MLASCVRVKSKKRKRYTNFHARKSILAQTTFVIPPSLAARYIAIAEPSILEDDEFIHHRAVDVEFERERVSWDSAALVDPDPYIEGRAGLRFDIRRGCTFSAGVLIARVFPKQLAVDHDAHLDAVKMLVGWHGAVGERASRIVQRRWTAKKPVAASRQVDSVSREEKEDSKTCFECWKILRNEVT